MRMPIIVQEIEIEGASSAWSIDGTPADCVKLGLEVLLRGQTPDVVVSGINKGPNLGTDVRTLNCVCCHGRHYRENPINSCVAGVV